MHRSSIRVSKNKKKKEIQEHFKRKKNESEKKGTAWSMLVGRLAGVGRFNAPEVFWDTNRGGWVESLR